MSKGFNEGFCYIHKIILKHTTRFSIGYYSIKPVTISALRTALIDFVTEGYLLIILRRRHIFHCERYFKTDMNGGECRMTVSECSLVTI